MIQKHQTACCALCQLTASNEDTLTQLRNAIKNIKNDAQLMWNPTDRASGERAIFIIVAPGEEKLAKNLRKLGFYIRMIFDRRNGYPGGKLEMWALTF